MFGKLFCQSAFEKKNSIIVFDKLLYKTDVKKNWFFKIRFCSFVFLAFLTQNCEKKTEAECLPNIKKLAAFFYSHFFQNHLSTKPELSFSPTSNAQDYNQHWNLEGVQSTKATSF